MSTTASTITIIITVCGVTFTAMKMLADSLRGSIGELRNEIGEVRNEMRAGFADVRSDIREIRSEVNGLRGDIGTLERTIVREHGERITRLEERL